MEFGCWGGPEALVIAAGGHEGLAERELDSEAIGGFEGEFEGGRGRGEGEGVHGFDPAFDDEGVGGSRGRGSECIQEGEDGGFGGLSGIWWCGGEDLAVENEDGCDKEQKCDHI